MRRVRFQNKVATGRFTLPVAAILTTLLWCAEGVYSLNTGLGWLLCGLTACLWTETGNTYSLIRIRSQLTPAVYLFLSGCIFSLHPANRGTVAALFLLASYNLLFRTYQRPEAVGASFHAFLCIGMGSLAFPQLLYFAPFYLWYAAVFLRSLTWRTFWASIIGLALPYWFYGGYALCTDHTASLACHLTTLACIQPCCLENYRTFGTLEAGSAILLVLFTLPAAIHCIRTSFNDKIRTRMFLYILLIQELLIVVFMALQPVHHAALLGLLVVNSAPILSHYFSLTNRWLSNALFILFLILFAALACFDLWTRLLIS